MRYREKSNGGRAKPNKRADSFPFEPAACFRLGGQRLQVLPNTVTDAWQASLPEVALVGELRLNDEEYVIVVAQDDATEWPFQRLVDVLTKREIQIVTLVAEGKVNKQIADQLKISEWTVSTHMRRIFAKLGVDSRAAMIYRCSLLV